MSLPFQARIANCYANLSPNARKIADYLQQNPLEVLTASTSDIAKATDTSKASVSRFFRQLGYPSHQEAKQELKALRHSGLPMESGQPQENYVEQQIQLIRQTWQQIDPSCLDSVVEHLCNASRVVFIGYRNSYPVAMHFRQQLQQIRPKTLLLPLPGQSLSEDLLDLSAKDFVVVVGFRRRTKHFSALIQQLSPYPTCLLTDNSGQAYANDVEFLLNCQLGQSRALDNYAAPHSVISVICNQAFSKLNGVAKKRVLQISNTYSDLSELDNN